MFIVFIPKVGEEFERNAAHAQRHQLRHQCRKRKQHPGQPDFLFAQKHGHKHNDIQRAYHNADVGQNAVDDSLPLNDAHAQQIY